ncbi:hypothetical protein [Paenibacillus elgii]|uniref:hypothetical protein n=1 Tax=Paenibacillus elgii TaxID=189691 RepID=UPI000248C6DE|nr:hypothetical protein [Paenibacillus elgii]
MDDIKIGSKVKAEITGAEGIVTVIHDDAAKIKITKGNTPITDYYLKDLRLIEEE